MIDEQTTSEIEALFLAWHLRHIDAQDVSSVERWLSKGGRIKPGTLAVRDELRPRVRSIFLALESCRLPADYEDLKHELIELCEPMTDTLKRRTDGGLLTVPSSDEAASAANRERYRRAEIVVDLMLECASYVDVRNPIELDAVADAIIQIHRKRAREASIAQMLARFVQTVGSQIKSNGHIIAIYVLGKEFGDINTVNQLLKIANNTGKTYGVEVQQQAVASLALIAADEPDLCLVSVCDAIGKFLRGGATSDVIEVQALIDDELAEILPRMGERMLKRLIALLIQPRKVRVDELTSERVELSRAIALFREDALAALLEAYQTNIDNKQAARPLIMTLRTLANDNSEYWDLPVSISNRDEKVTLLDLLMETLERNAPAADLAGHILGLVSYRQRVRELLWNKANDDNVVASVRATCLWALVEFGNVYGREITDLCHRWISLDASALDVTATLILFLKENPSMKARFTEMLVKRKDAAIKYCRAATGRIMPILLDMLHNDNDNHREVAADILASLGRSGWDILASEYWRLQDPDRRMLVLKPLVSIPVRELRRYNAVIDHAFAQGSVGERQLVEEIVQRVAPIPG